MYNHLKFPKYFRKFLILYVYYTVVLKSHFVYIKQLYLPSQVRLSSPNVYPEMQVHVKEPSLFVQF